MKERPCKSSSLQRALACLALVVAHEPILAADPSLVPVFQEGFPDPFILEKGGTFIAYATNTARGRENVQMAVSRDLVHWEHSKLASGALRDALPQLPSWAKRGATWAPEVLRTDAGYVLYFTARHRESGLQCVGAAISEDPLGPFTSNDPEPLVCQYDLGGTIDASPFRDADRQLYLYFKNDGNHPSARRPTEIFAQRLSPDGLKLVGERVSLLRNDQPWEGRVIEAPVMVLHEGRYTMFFAANDYGWPEHQALSPYATGFASCRGPVGPCTDSPGNPLLHSRYGAGGFCVSGPGHPAVFETGERTYIAFHGWQTTADCRRGERKRLMYIAPLTWRNGAPEVGASLHP